MRKKKEASRGLKNGLTLGPHDCRYIIGEVGLPEQTQYCGKPVKHGSPYCEAHHALCYDKKAKVAVPFQGYPKKRG